MAVLGCNGLRCVINIILSLHVLSMKLLFWILGNMNAIFAIFLRFSLTQLKERRILYTGTRGILYTRGQTAWSKPLSFQVHTHRHAHIDCARQHETSLSTLSSLRTYRDTERDCAHSTIIVSMPDTVSVCLSACTRSCRNTIANECHHLCDSHTYAYRYTNKYSTCHWNDCFYIYIYMQLYFWFYTYIYIYI